MDFRYVRPFLPTFEYATPLSCKRAMYVEAGDIMPFKHHLKCHELYLCFGILVSMNNISSYIIT